MTVVAVGTGVTAHGDPGGTGASGTASSRPPGERYFRHPGDVVRLSVWAATTILIVLFVVVASRTSDGVRADLGDAATQVPPTVRQLLLAGVQLTAVVAPVAVVAALVARRRWRRLATLLAAGAAGAALVLLLGMLEEEPAAVSGALAGDAWLISTRFPSLAYVGAAVAAGTVGKPWLSRRWRRALDVSLVVLGATMAVAGSAGLPELVLAAAAGGAAGAAILVAVGAPNRWPAPAEVAAALGGAGLDVVQLDVERAVGGRAQLYRVATAAGPVFAKVYGQDSRDADLLYRSYRAAVLRDGGGTWSWSLAGDVEHEALLMLLAERGDVACRAAPRRARPPRRVDGAGDAGRRWVPARCARRG